MKYNVELSNPANEDLKNIYRYIYNELKSPISASNILNKIQKVVLSLDEMPNRHTLYEKEPWKSRNLRFVPVGNYMVFYIADDEQKEVTIIRVMYGGMDIESKFNNMQ